MADYEEQTASTKLAGVIEKNKKIFITVLVVVVCLLAGYIIFAAISNNAKNKGIQTLDEISYELTEKSSDLEASEIDSRIAVAMEKAAPYTKKSGVVGTRANMFCAELAFRQEKYEESADYWKAAAAKAKKTYLGPIAYYNLAVCYENLGNKDQAAENYKIAAEDKDFVMRAHAYFSYGRLLEEMGDYAGASAAYTEVNSLFPGKAWADLAKTRLISLKNDGKIE